MENLNNNGIKNSGRVWSGLIILILGLAFLINNIGLDIPNWIFSWSNFLILLGVFIGVRKNFKGIGWLILILLGAYNTINSMHLDINLSKYALGIGLIIVGGFLIIKPKGAFNRNKNFNSRFKDEFSTAPNDSNEFTAKEKDGNNHDIIDVIAVFGGNNQTIYSKNFMGGDITAVFGGADIIMTQADFNESASLDVTAIFGGIKLIVPQNWAIKSNVTAIFGSVEDKRAQFMPMGEIQKTLILDGTVLFGGIEIKSF